MKKDSIAQLRLLRTLHPSDALVASLKERVFSGIDMEKSKSPEVESFSNTALIAWGGFSRLAYGFSVVVFFVTSVFFIQGDLRGSRQMITEAKIWFSSNEYDQSVIALDTFHRTLFDFERTEEDQIVAAIDEFSQSSNRTRIVLASLNLVGEPGQYTQKECEGVYREYYDFLEITQELIAHKLSLNQDPTVQQALEVLRQEMESSRQETISRINMYPQGHE